MEETAETEDDLPSTVTLLVSEKQALLLADLEKSGTIHMSLVYRGNRTKAEEFLKAQEELNNGTEQEKQEGQEETPTESAESEAVENGNAQ